MVLGFTAAGSLSFYTFTTYMQKYLVNTAGMTAGTASMIMTAALFVYMLVQPLFWRPLGQDWPSYLNALFWRVGHPLYRADS